MPRDYLPGWLPQAVTAGVHLQPVEQLTGTPPGRRGPAVEHLSGPRASTRRPTRRACSRRTPRWGSASAPPTGGGVAAPAIKLDALSATQGAMPSKMAAGVDAATLKSLLAGMKLFGTVDLADLLAPDAACRHQAGQPTARTRTWTPRWPTRPPSSAPR